ncbi:MAG: hypothetical protein KAR20_01980 [Candidatus Heimdallarchaeota archaeon]|nr:hypothetical protein [Candidatus Heimdallarchaeota archaeon]
MNNIYDTQGLANKIVEGFYDRPKTTPKHKELVSSGLMQMVNPKVNFQDPFNKSTIRVKETYGKKGVLFFQELQRIVLTRGIDYAGNKLRSLGMPEQEISNAHEAYRQDRVEVYKKQQKMIDERKKQECMRMQTHQSQEYNNAAEEIVDETNLQNLLNKASFKS